MVSDIIFVSDEVYLPDYLIGMGGSMQTFYNGTDHAYRNVSVFFFSERVKRQSWLFIRLQIDSSCGSSSTAQIPQIKGLCFIHVPVYNISLM